MVIFKIWVDLSRKKIKICYIRYKNGEKIVDKIDSFRRIK